MSTETTTYTITGHDAARLAERDGLTLSDNGTVTVQPVGWHCGVGDVRPLSDGQDSVDQWFDGCRYLGPDANGVEPKWVDAMRTMSDIEKYLATLDREAIEDWAAGRLDEVMTDHAATALGRVANTEIIHVAEAMVRE